MVYGTSCKNCAFALYNQDEQIGCVHNRLEKFSNLGYLVEKNPEDKHFCIGGICNYCIDKGSWERCVDREKRLFDITKIKNTFMIFSDNNRSFNDVYNDILYWHNQLMISEIQPVKIIFIINKYSRFISKDNLKLSELVKSLFKDSKVEYEIVYCDCPHTINHLLNIIRYKVKTDYLSVFESSYQVSQYFNVHLNKILNDDAVTFLMITGDNNHNGWTVHKKFLDNFSWGVEDKFVGDQVLEETRSMDNQFINNLVLDGEKYDFYAKPTTGHNSNSQS